MRYVLFTFLLSMVTPLAAQQEKLSEHALKTFEIFKTIVEVDTSKAMGNTPKVARYLAECPRLGNRAKTDRVDAELSPVSSLKNIRAYALTHPLQPTSASWIA